ncbi:hypothetical protein DWW79_02520 [Alistipes sp. AF17-16]|nr:hypothetical protein DWW79_02520 [Alistipes sp. AF17-16]
MVFCTLWCKPTTSTIHCASAEANDPFQYPIHPVFHTLPFSPAGNSGPFRKIRKKGIKLHITVKKHTFVN